MVTNAMLDIEMQDLAPYSLLCFSALMAESVHRNFTQGVIFSLLP